MSNPQPSNDLVFRLSDPGTTLNREPKMLEYLRNYGLPAPPELRYGCIRLQSPQKNYPVTLFAQAWLPAHVEATILLVHGYAEHSANYARLIQDFTREKFAVIAIDLRGHGLSEGAKAHVESPTHYAEDIEHILPVIFSTLLPTRPLYLWGHSLGGLVTLQMLLRNQLPVEPKAAVVTSPLLGFPEVSGLQKIAAHAAPFLARFFPSMPVPHGLQASWLSHDAAYLARREKDPLISNHTTPAWYLQMQAAVNQLQQKAPQFSNVCPILCLLAGDERIANLADARRFANIAFPAHKHQTIEFPQQLHELEKEPQVRARILSESLAWFRRENS